jgi:UDP-2,3-diacylglucosamine pyrophosphatase LpxH
MSDDSFFENLLDFKNLIDEESKEFDLVSLNQLLEQNTEVGVMFTGKHWKKVLEIHPHKEFVITKQSFIDLMGVFNRYDFSYDEENVYNKGLKERLTDRTLNTLVSIVEELRSKRLIERSGRVELAVKVLCKEYKFNQQSFQLVESMIIGHCHTKILVEKSGNIVPQLANTQDFALRIFRKPIQVEINMLKEI